MKKIQIALVSKEALPVFYIIYEFMPDIVYLVGTKETATVMKHIEDVAKLHNIACKQCITTANDMEACAKVCEQIHLHNGSDVEYIYNLTGGTKLMAFGALACAQSHNAKIVYTDTHSYVDLSTMERKPLTNMLDTDTIISLQGQKVKEKSVYAFNAQRTECALAVRDFISRHTKTYEVLMKKYRKDKQLPNSYESGKVYYEHNDAGIFVEYDDVEVFSSDYRGAFKMLFEGRWWETLVANAVAKHFGKDAEIWVNVRFEPNTETARNLDKNEIDVLVNIGNTLLFVECKSGSFTQDNIYKLRSVCQTYGSYKSKGCIVEFRETCVKPELKEKAKDDNIQIIVPNRNLGNLSQQLNEIIYSLNA